MFGTLFLLGVSVSISYPKTMFYTEIKAATITNQSIYSLKELPNKKLVFLSRGDQSTGHFAIGFLDSIGQIVDYTTYNSNSPSFASYQISISPDNKYAIISGTASGAHLIGGWSDPRIISIDLNTKAINWAKNMGPGCFNGYGQAVEVIDNSTAIISYGLYPESFVCNPPRSIIEKVNLNNYNVIYRKTLKRSSLSYWTAFKISKLPGNSNIAVLFSSNFVANSGPPGRLGIAILNSDNGNVVLYRYPQNGLIISGFRNNHVAVYDYIGVQVGYMLLTSDTGFLIAGINYYCTPSPTCMPPITDLEYDTTTFRLVQMHLVKFDKNGNVKWSKIFYSNTFSVQPNGLAEVSDGYIVGALVGHYEFGFFRYVEDTGGYRRGYFRFYHPAIIKIDKNNGNIIWAYKYIPTNDIVNPSQRITFSWFPSFDNIVITYDSGIVVYGFRVKHTIQNPKPHMSLTRLTSDYSGISFNEQYGWILKTDKNGNTCPSIQKQSLNLVVQNYSYTNDNVNFYTENYNFNPPDFNPTQTTGLYYTNNNCYITPVSNDESNNCSSKEFKLLNNKIVFDQERDFKIYNLEGKLIYSGKAKEYIIKKDGFYILKINNNTYKILIK
jgi:hypothetical protein